MAWSLRKTVALAVVPLAVSMAFGPARAAEPGQEARHYVEGVFTLAEWHTGAEVFRPPLVDGRFVLAEGVVVTVLKNFVKPDKKIELVEAARRRRPPAAS